METKYHQIFHNNQKWVQKKLREDAHYFQKLAKGQSPEYLWIGCSDSRVPANEITGTQPGEMFVHRNIANMVVKNDMNLLSVLSYAVEVLKVKHIIVCGHYGCGGVLAAMNKKRYGLIDQWLDHIDAVYKIHHNELDAMEDKEARFRRFVELNVSEQVNALCRTSIVQNAWKAGQILQVHGWTYDIHDGLLHDLGFSFSKSEEQAVLNQFE